MRAATGKHTGIAIFAFFYLLGCQSSEPNWFICRSRTSSGLFSPNAVFENNYIGTIEAERELFGFYSQTGIELRLDFYEFDKDVLFSISYSVGVSELTQMVNRLIGKEVYITAWPQADGNAPNLESELSDGAHISIVHENLDRYSEAITMATFNQVLSIESFQIEKPQRIKIFFREGLVPISENGKTEISYDRRQLMNAAGYGPEVSEGEIDIISGGEAFSMTCPVLVQL